MSDISSDILSHIEKANSILLHCHPSPDPDSVGSVLAMKFALENMGKKVTAIQGDSVLPKVFLNFPGAKDIEEKSFSSIDLKDFDLFIILDSASKEMITREKELIFPLPIKTILIDHHVSNKSYADINFLDISSGATAFTLYNLFLKWKIKIDHDIALNLFIGMYTDTGGFKYSSTDYKMLEAAATLAKIAPDYTKILFTLDNSNEKESIFFQALALSSIKTYHNDNLAISALSRDELRKRNISREDENGSLIANILKSVVGWNIGASLVETEPNQIKISFRTRDADKYDVSKIATALGGGGHKAASGAVLFSSIDEAVKKVVENTKIIYNL